MIERFVSADAMGEAAARAVATRLADGVAQRGRASLVATGGRAPGPVYDHLQDAKLDWARVVTTLSDERCVAGESEDSNAHLLHERLLRGATARSAFLPLWRDDARPPELEPAIRALAPFDAVLLGMGEDGHIASLIPGMPGLAQALDLRSEQLVVDVPAGLGSPPVARISLTLAALSQARLILLLIAGETKRQVVEQAQAGGDLPVAVLLAQDRAPVRILWSPRHEERRSGDVKADIKQARGS
ncbi:MAG: 6-phosphogluconolactonase [Phenylobacterium sp.]|uniref:6-phosphogluconolactonase n=1 Tax=Phenylobacterium sp. TaxID=1871053 RepID=UPI0027357B1E|nr:6-phosphogluconolactonase [Phenylobacterium sp.]MDP3174364.1 6-phosphogluconolactonase [Phenylobacterium sp.]